MGGALAGASGGNDKPENWHTQWTDFLETPPVCLMPTMLLQLCGARVS